MSTKIEQKAKKYLLNKFNKPGYRFTESNQNGFDLLLKIERQQNIKIELKATKMKFEEKNKNKIFSQLYFSSEKEVELFQKGKTKILRIFLGNRPYKMFLIDKKILKNDVKFQIEYRAKLVGKKNYNSEGISKFP